MKKNLYILLILIGFAFNASAQNKLDGGMTSSRIMKYYPNPATTEIKFDCQRGFDKNYSLQIFNFMGKKVYEFKNISYQMNINLDGFYRGIYIFQLRDKNGSIVESGKFQVNK